MIETVKELEETIEKGKDLSFEEYAAMREPSFNIIVNDYAAKLLDLDKKKGGKLTLDEAREIARKEIPMGFVPEWMKNLRISANMAGTELCYLEGIRTALERIEELLRVIGDEAIDRYIDRHANDMKRLADGEEVKDGNDNSNKHSG